MSSFTEGVFLRFDKNSDIAHITQSFFYHIDAKDSPTYIFVDAGFPTDGNSRPWVFGWLIPQYGRFTKAAVVHDSLYARPYVYRMDEGGFKVTRKSADQIFHQALIVLGCSKWRAWLIYRALRVFGGFAWHKHRKSDKGAITARITKPQTPEDN